MINIKTGLLTTLPNQIKRMGESIEQNSDILKLIQDEHPKLKKLTEGYINGIKKRKKNCGRNQSSIKKLFYYSSSSKN